MEAKKTKEQINVFECFAREPKAQASSAENSDSNTQADGRWLEICDTLFSSAATFVLSIALAVERKTQLPGETMPREQTSVPADEQMAIDWDKFDHLTSASPAPSR